MDPEPLSASALTPKLIIRRPSFFGTQPASRPAQPNTVEVAFPDVRTWARDGAIIRHLLRHPEAELRTHRIAHVSKPFLTALLLRVLSHGRCFFSDDTGERLEIDFGVILKYGLWFLRDLARVPLLLLTVERQVERLEKEAARPRRPPPLDLTRPPLYLRSDLLFNVKAGGSVSHIAGVLNQLDRFAAKPVFITTDHIPTVRADLETHLIVPGMDFCGYPELPSLYFNRLLTSRALGLLSGRSVSFIYQRYSPNNFCGLALSRQLKAPFVLEYNGSEVWISRNWGEPLEHERLALRIETLVLKGAHVIVVVSRPLRDELVARGIARDQILVNPNGVDADMYSPAVDGHAIRQRYGLEGKRVLGFIGTFGRWHGAVLLADAFGRLMVRHPEWRDSVRLLMIGDGLTMPDVRANLERHGVQELATLTGLVPQEQGPAHLAACDVLISPHVPNRDGTPFFGSPTKVFEYMAMGKSIIASALDQIGEVLRHGETAWMVEPGNAEALVSAIERLLGDESLARRLGEAARQDLLAHYTWKEHTRRIVERLQESCRGANAGAPTC